MSTTKVMRDVFSPQTASHSSTRKDENIQVITVMVQGDRLLVLKWYMSYLASDFLMMAFRGLKREKL